MGIPSDPGISTHALTEGDKQSQRTEESTEAFQLTPSRRATTTRGYVALRHGISTHALTEGDMESGCSCRRLRHFNSRPHGGRQYSPTLNTAICVFQLTPSRRATRICFLVLSHSFNFNSRPHGGRLHFYAPVLVVSVFQLTPSRRATRIQPFYWLCRSFQLTPSRRATE